MTANESLKESTGVFNNALAVKGAYALRWHPGFAPNPAAATLAEAENAQVLAVEASLDESASSDKLKDESPQLALELHRLELKMNLLLKICGELLAREQKLPAPRVARISAVGVECEADPSMKSGERGVLELYVNRSLPYALRFQAVIDGERTEPRGRLVHLRFEAVSDALADQMSKLIFRKHRRLVALARHS
ncbi:MAG: PilZ domain-containing protein [Proteobacteria bacterium]|nr:PilZ domain-containing protein [Pseudomonadota bacterium]